MKNLEVKEIIRDSERNIIGYELNTGSIIDNEQAVYMIKRGELTNVRIVNDKNGAECIEGIGFDIESLPEMK
ncbi:hypothetical protein Q428_13865 [Fervidicella metallireducens AeB]|uniref:Uncharacterized protein n=1 Tax=Fervidicella metallireducens AeB TaxID=1403537 RepID=A0A017RTV9_9CLOT|nr:DUF3892 domain-containing protein [Fervidicella metallireducens]EYE87340.1 hypothetical protein Q428_13865 [Fervidicella metallireducens AeB]